jgi:nitroimidazol reductase NimA-like FMN-containing flavoprotein (pyridoxamine 5'-phosphate oxidase superfamily)
MKRDKPEQPEDKERALSEILEILDEQRFAVLSTHSDGQPYASLVAFSVTRDIRKILFCTPRSTRKYANLSCDARVAMLVHNSHNAAIDCEQAVSVTATGAAIEIRGDQPGEERATFLAKHPDLEDFVTDPLNAFMSVEVSDYHFVRRFQDVLRIRMVPEVDFSRNADDET